jgi:hypothetical protein
VSLRFTSVSLALQDRPVSRAPITVRHEGIKDVVTSEDREPGQTIDPRGRANVLQNPLNGIERVAPLAPHPALPVRHE